MKQVIKNEIIIEECNRKEALQIAEDIISSNFTGSDLFVSIEYNDGSVYTNYEGCEEGSFRKTNIRGIMIDNSATFQIFGSYEVVDSIPVLI